jgi:hypothetical protein
VIPKPRFCRSSLPVVHYRTRSSPSSGGPPQVPSWARWKASPLLGRALKGKPAVSFSLSGAVNSLKTKVGQEGSMLPSHVDGRSHIVSKHDELLMLCGVMGPKGPIDKNAKPAALMNYKDHHIEVSLHVMVIPRVGILIFLFRTVKTVKVCLKPFEWIRPLPSLTKRRKPRSNMRRNG